MDMASTNDTGFGTPEVRSTTNAFLNAYQQWENKLTYNFLALLEHLDVCSALKLLAVAGLHSPFDADTIRVSLLYGGLEGNPGGSITLARGTETTELFFENKTWRRRLDQCQLRRHRRSLMQRDKKQHLLVISADRQDKNRLAALGEPRLLFTTWQDGLENA